MRHSLAQMKKKGPTPKILLCIARKKAINFFLLLFSTFSWQPFSFSPLDSTYSMFPLLFFLKKFLSFTLSVSFSPIRTVRRPFRKFSIFNQRGPYLFFVVVKNKEHVSATALPTYPALEQSLMPCRFLIHPTKSGEDLEH